MRLTGVERTASNNLQTVLSNAKSNTTIQMSSNNSFTAPDGFTINGNTDASQAVDSLRGSGPRRIRNSDSRRRNLKTYAEAYIDDRADVILGDFDTATVQQEPEQTPIIRIPSNRYEQLATDFEREQFDQKIQYAMIVHELGHIRYTPSDYAYNNIYTLPKNQQPAAKRTWNALEDCAIEEQLRHDLGTNIANRLSTLHANLSAAQLADASYPIYFSVINAVSTAILDLGRYDSRTLHALRDENNDDVQFVNEQHQDLFEDFFGEVEQVVQDVLTTGDPYERTDRIFDFWEDFMEHLDQNDDDDIDQPQGSQNGDAGEMDNRGMPDDMDNVSPTGGENQSNPEQAGDLGNETDEEDVRKRIRSVIKEEPETEAPESSIDENNTGSDSEPEAADEDNEVKNASSNEDSTESNPLQGSGSQGGSENGEADSTSTGQTRDNNSIGDSSESDESPSNQGSSSPESSNSRGETSREDTPSETSENDTETDTSPDKGGADGDESTSNGSAETDEQAVTSGRRQQKTLFDFDSEESAKSDDGDDPVNSDGNASTEGDEKPGSDHGSTSLDGDETSTDASQQSTENIADDSQQESGNITSESSSPETQPDDSQVNDTSTETPSSNGEESSDSTSPSSNEPTRRSSNETYDSTGDDDHDDEAESSETGSSEDEPNDEMFEPDENAPPGTGEDDLDTSKMDDEALDRQLSQERQESKNEDGPLEEEIEAFSEAIEAIAEEASGDGASDTEIESIELHPEPNNNFEPEVWDEAEQQSQVTAQLLKRALKREQRDDFRRGLPTGEVDGSQLFGLESGDFNIMQQRHPGQEKDYNVVIVLDRSYSMDGDDIEVAEKSLVEFSLALEELGIDVCIMDMHDNKARLISPFGVKIERSQESLVNRDAAGGTPLHESLAIGRHRLETKPGNNFILMITDGKPSDEDAYTDELENAFMPVLGINLALGENHQSAFDRLQGQSKFYDTNAIVTSGSELENELELLIHDIAF